MRTTLTPLRDCTCHACVLRDTLAGAERIHRSIRRRRAVRDLTLPVAALCAALTAFLAVL